MLNEHEGELLGGLCVGGDVPHLHDILIENSYHDVRVLVIKLVLECFSFSSDADVLCIYIMLQGMVRSLARLSTNVRVPPTLILQYIPIEYETFTPHHDGSTAIKQHASFAF